MNLIKLKDINTGKSYKKVMAGNLLKMIFI